MSYSFLLVGILLALLAGGNIHAEEETSTGSTPASSEGEAAVAKTEVTQPPEENYTAAPQCPYERTVRQECGKNTYSAENLFEGSAAIDPFVKGIQGTNRCKLWWWSHHVAAWEYAPLLEWAEYAKDALVENVDNNVLSKILGLAPAPPSTKLNSRDLPVAKCTRPSGIKEIRIAEKLRRLNLWDISPEFLDELVGSCLAFEVETAPWKRIITSVVGAYLLPIGNTNFVIVARPRFTLFQNPESQLLDEEDQASSGMAYSATGACPVTQDPRACVESLIGEAKSKRVNLIGKRTIRMKALPFRIDVDALYRGGRITEPLSVDLNVGEDGGVSFFFRRDDGQNIRINLGLREGQLSLDTDEKLCDPNYEAGRKLYLRPLALGDRLEVLYDALSLYHPSDFPESDRLEKTGVEKGCAGGKSYSEWAAETANAAKHYAGHGTPFDTLYRSIAHQRFRWTAESKGVAKTKEGLIYGEWRKEALDTMIPIRGPFEAQAVKFARQSGESTESDSTITYRLIKIDGQPATEVWFYMKPLSFIPGKEGKKGHVVIHHLRNFQEIYARSVISQLVNLSTTCSTADDQRTGFLGAMYALFNAAPLEQGDEIVGKVFMAATYHNIFGKKLPNMKKMVDIEIDALTLPYDTFLSKYSLLIP